MESLETGAEGVELSSQEQLTQVAPVRGKMVHIFSLSISPARISCSQQRSRGRGEILGGGGKGGKVLKAALFAPSGRAAVRDSFREAEAIVGPKIQRVCPGLSR